VNKLALFLVGQQCAIDGKIPFTVIKVVHSPPVLSIFRLALSSLLLFFLPISGCSRHGGLHDAVQIDRFLAPVLEG
jgi:hypothetical protein